LWAAVVVVVVVALGGAARLQELAAEAALAAEQARHLADQQVAVAQGQRLTNAVALCQALSGGWWNAFGSQFPQANP